MKPKWQLLADKLRARIDDGTYPPGTALPPMDELVDQGEGARATVHQAYRALEAAGYVVMAPRRGTIVRDRTTVYVPLSRYGKVLRPGGRKGPWETATAEQGLNGRMITTSVTASSAPADVAGPLGIETGSAVVLRSRHAMIGNDVVQTQRAWYPQDIADRAGLGDTGEIVGGIYGALAAAGLTPSVVDEVVSARMPTPEEAAEISIGSSIPVLTIERITRDHARRALELLRVVGAADRLRLVYDGLPLRRSGPAARGGAKR